MPRVSRVVVLGNSTVGKSALIASILGQPLDVKEYEPTQRVSTVRTNACIPSLSPTGNPSDPCCFQEFEIVDTPGKVAFAQRAVEELKEGCRGQPIDAALLVFALNDKESFADIERIWAPVAQALGIPSVLCGNKMDLQPEEGVEGADRGVIEHKKADDGDDDDDTFIQDREKGIEITPSQGAALADKLGCARYVECSALSRVGLENTIHVVVRQAVLRVSALDAEAKRQEAEQLRMQKEIEEKRRAEQEHFQALGVPTVVVLGPPASGKTSFIGALLGEKWSNSYYPHNVVTSRKMPIKSKYYDTVQFVEIPDEFPDTYGLIQQIAKQSPNCFYFVCVPVVEIRSFARLARFYTELVREADAPGQTVIVGTKVDLLELEVGEGESMRTVPYFAGVDRATGEKVAQNISALSYIECSAISMFGIKNALDELLPHVIAPRTVGQNVRGALRGAGMLFGWLANSLINSATPEDIGSFDGEEDDELLDAAAGEKDDLIVGEFSNDKRIHVFVVGDRGSGKTTLVRRYLKQPFVPEAPAVQNGTLRFAMRGRPYAPQDYEIIVWDCATLMPVFPDNHSKSTVVIALDVTRPNAIKSTMALYREMELQFGTLFCGRVIVLTHTDKESVISEEQLQHFAEDINCSRIIRTGGAETDEVPLSQNPIQLAVRHLLVRHRLL